MPEQTTRIEERRGEAEPRQGQLAYLSKSRLKKYTTCPEQFRYSYVEQLSEPETAAMRRGTEIHETIEEYYYNLTNHVHRTGKLPEFLVPLLPDVTRWSDHLHPYMTNFISWEQERCRSVDDPFDVLPVGVEEEGWLEAPLGLNLPNDVSEVPWMGFADIILPAEGLPSVGTNRGEVIVDIKTGKTPKEEYREEGIFLECEFYAALFEDEYDITAVAGYYPKNDDLIVSRPDHRRRVFIEDKATELQTTVAEQQDSFEIDEQPLCGWGEGSENQCPFYEACPSTWKKPAKNKQRFIELVENGASFSEIAEELDMNDTDPIGYWKYKFDL